MRHAGDVQLTAGGDHRVVLVVDAAAYRVDAHDDDTDELAGVVGDPGEIATRHRTDDIPRVGWDNTHSATLGGGRVGWAVRRSEGRTRSLPLRAFLRDLLLPHLHPTRLPRRPMARHQRPQ